jgi:hypothetical protein
VLPVAGTGIKLARVTDDPVLLWTGRSRSPQNVKKETLNTAVILVVLQIERQKPIYV